MNTRLILKIITAAAIYVPFTAIVLIIVLIVAAIYLPIGAYKKLKSWVYA